MKATFLAVVVLAFSSHYAFAVSIAVKLACRDDYFAHCSMHSPGSPGVRKCMRDVGPRLSSRCIGALADAGMIKGKKSAGKTVVAKAKGNRQHIAQAKAAKNTYAQKRSKKTYASKPQIAKKQVAAKQPAKRTRYSKAKLNRQFAARD